ncbi:MAG: universal stress protein [Bacteroidota bacterium]
MANIQSILVPVDFTEVSAGAYHYALQLADRLGAGIDLLYCIPPVGGSAESGVVTVTLLETLRERAEGDMEAFYQDEMRAVRDQLRQPPTVDTFVATGDLRYEIRRHVRREGNDLIVMGTHGAADGWDRFFGTNASFLIDKSPCPVIVVPAGVSFRPLTSVCYATDLDHVDAFRAGHLLRMFDPFRPELHFVHVAAADGKKSEFSLDLLREVFGRPGSGVRATFTETRHENAAVGVFEHAKQHNCDLVVMFRPQEGWLGRLFRKSVTREAVLKATAPLLIFGKEDLE